MRRQDIENLSNLVFGLSLSIVALILISNPPSSPGQMYQDLLWFAYSFMIVITVWRSYVTIVSEIEEWRGRDIRLNILLLLFVGMEPYLFNAITFQNSLLPPEEQDIMNNVGSSLFALDIAAIFIILATYYHIVAREKARGTEREEHLIGERNYRLVVGGLFAISALPWTWSIHLGTTELRYLIWLVPLIIFMIMAVRRIMRRHQDDDEE